MDRKENMKRMVEINRKMNDEKKRKVKTEAEKKNCIFKKTAKFSLFSL